MPLRVAFALVAAGEVEHLDEVVRSGQHHLEALERVAVRTLVGQGVPEPQGAARHRLDLGDQAEPGPFVDELDPQPGVDLLERGAREPGRPVPAAVALSAQVRPGEPSAGVLTEQRQAGTVRQQGEAGRVGTEQADREHDGETVVPAVQLDARRRGLRVTRKEHRTGQVIP